MEEGGRGRGGGKRREADEEEEQKLAGKKAKIYKKKARKWCGKCAHAAHIDFKQKSIDFAYEIISQN